MSITIIASVDVICDKCGKTDYYEIEQYKPHLQLEDLGPDYFICEYGKVLCLHCYEEEDL